MTALTTWAYLACRVGAAPHSPESRARPIAALQAGQGQPWWRHLSADGEARRALPPQDRGCISPPRPMATTTTPPRITPAEPLCRSAPVSRQSRSSTLSTLTGSNRNPCPRLSVCHHAPAVADSPAITSPATRRHSDFDESLIATKTITATLTGPRANVVSNGVSSVAFGQAAPPSPPAMRTTAPAYGISRTTSRDRPLEIPLIPAHFPHTVMACGQCSLSGLRGEKSPGRLPHAARAPRRSLARTPACLPLRPT